MVPFNDLGKTKELGDSGCGESISARTGSSDSGSCEGS